MVSDKQRSEFEELVKPLMKFLNDNFNPHTTIIVAPDSAEVLTGEVVFSTSEFILD